MDADLSKLSAAELHELVRELQDANEQLRSSSISLSQLSVTVQQSLESAAVETPRALLAVSQFLTVEHSDEDLAAMLDRQSAELFGVDGALLFLADAEGALAPVSVGGPLAERPETADHIAAAAHQAYESQSLVAQAGVRGVTPACAALPLARRGAGIGALVLVRAQDGPLSFSPEGWSLLEVFGGVVAVACANLLHVAELRRETRLLEALVEQRTRQVQSSRDVLRAVFDHLPDGVLLLDGDDTVLAANAMFCERVLGRHPRDVVGRLYAQVRQEADARTGAARYVVERVAVPQDGQAEQRLEFWRERLNAER